MIKISIVIIGYNRVDSMKRLVNSLLAATYYNDVDLIISIDNSGSSDVELYANSIQWPYGDKIVRTFSKRLGLRDHILKCGTYMQEYNLDAIIVLEDDVVVAPNFFNFAVQAVKKYQYNMDIAGISLYTHLWNINADRPFMPIFCGFDVFLMNYPQSWGQVWMKNQWEDFYRWYNAKKYENINVNHVPDNVLSWSKSSWLKYHVEYCISEKKYFIYPYHALSTNFADAGENYAVRTNKMQIPLSLDINKEYRFPAELRETAKYDAFFENEKLSEYLGVNKEELEIDLYGKKKVYEKNIRYLLTTDLKPFHIVKTFGLQMRPWDLNIIFGVHGKEIYLYDITAKVSSKPKLRHKSLIHWNYDTKGEVILKRNVIDILFSEVKNKITCLIRF